MSAKAEYLEWRRGLPVGCVFARLMSKRPANFGQVVEEIRGAAPANVAAVIAARVDEFVADEAVVAAAFVLPEITTLRALTEMALALRAHPKWLVRTSRLEPPPNSDLVAVAILRELPLDDESRLSEALVLGEFEVFPPTRRAPVTALELFVGVPLRQDPKTHQPINRVNLAHIDLLDADTINVDLAPPAIDSMWAKSKEGRLRSLGGVEDNRAKARVSFVIPASLAHELECAP